MGERYWWALLGVQRKMPTSTVGGGPRSPLFFTAPLPQDVLVRHPSPAEELPQWLSGKESAFKAGDPVDSGSIPGSGRSPGEGNGFPLQESCLKKAMDRGV